ncbi:MAG: hypothetical protein FWF96_06550 [Kiritimatiellaeota bacterium]|nr:hypothetical protein [Kiritimatiellota bacterium]
MKVENRGEKTILSAVFMRRLLAFFIFPLSVFFILRAAPWTEASSLCGSICRELLAGTNEGRQALLGSAFDGPLGPLLVLPWGWFLHSDLAVHAGAATGLLLLFFICARSFNTPEPGGLGDSRIFFIFSLFSALALARTGLDPQAVACAACAVYAFRCGAHWSRWQRMRDLVGCAAGLAGLALCGVAGWCAALAAFLFIPLGLLRAPAELRRRWPAVLLLGTLPMLYAFGVWMLMNRLVFGDAFYFLRPLAQEAVRNLPRVPLAELPWRAPSDEAAKILPLTLRFLPSVQGVAAAVALLAFLACAATRKTAHILAGVLLALAVASGLALARLGLGWAVSGLFAAALPVAICLLASLARAGHFAGFAGMSVFILFAIPVLHFPETGHYWGSPNREIVSAAVNEIHSRTEHGRLFVCGYSGLALLDALAEPPGFIKDTVISHHRRPRADTPLPPAPRPNPNPLPSPEVDLTRPFTAMTFASAVPYADTLEDLDDFSPAAVDAAPSDCRIVRPSLDLHIGQLRRDYHGQNLFILRPAPLGRAAADAVWRTHATPADLSRDRALFVREIGGWQLYEIIGAPTQKQLDEWAF